MYEVVDLGRRLLEDERPEVRDLCDELGALFVKRRVEGFRLADCARLASKFHLLGN